VPGFAIFDARQVFDLPNTSRLPLPVYDRMLNSFERANKTSFLEPEFGDGTHGENEPSQFDIDEFDSQRS